MEDKSELEQVGRVTAAAASLEFAVMLALQQVSGIRSTALAFALFGHLQFEPAMRTLERAVKALREQGFDLGDDWDEALKGARRFMNERNGLVHSTWFQARPPSGGDPGAVVLRSWKTVLGTTEDFDFRRIKLLAASGEAAAAAVFRLGVTRIREPDEPLTP